jgi:hypothetical protein
MAGSKEPGEVWNKQIRLWTGSDGGTLHALLDPMRVVAMAGFERKNLHHQPFGAGSAGLNVLVGQRLY